METTMRYGARKGKMNFFRRWMAKSASRELCLFPVPGPDILRIYQSGPLNGEAQLTANPREANVLLIIGDMNPDMAEQAAIVYAQMPRPRVLVLAGPKHLDPLPHPDVHVALEKDFLQTALPAVRECLSSLAWIDEPEPYQPEALVNEIEEAGKQQGHMHHHHHHGHGDHGHGDHDHSQHSGHGHSHEGHDHSAHSHADHGEHEGHDPSAHQHGNAEEGHNHDHGNHDHGHLSGHKKEGHDHSAHTHSAHEGHDHSHEDHKNHGHSHSGEAEAGESKGCHRASDKPGHDHGTHDHDHPQHTKHQLEGHSHSHGQQSGEKKDSHSGHDHGAHHHDHGHEQEGHELSGHQHGEHSHGHEGHSHEEHDHSQHEEHGHEHGGHDHGHNHGGHDHGHGGHDHGSGFMSMIAMTKDLPRSTDGLPMEWSDVQFGPFHPGMPGGLRLSMKLDGDTVAEAEADQELPSRNLLASIPEDPAALPEYLEAINPMAPVTYRLLAQKALLNFSDEAGNSALTLFEAVLLEKERITSHLNWLAVFATALGSGWMRDQAIKHYHRFQNGIGNMEQLSGFIRRIKKMPYLKLKLSAAVHNPGGTEKHSEEAAGTHKDHHHEHNADSHSGHCHEESGEQKPHDHGGHEGHEHDHGAHGHGEEHDHHEGHGHSHEGHQHGEHDHHSHEMHQHTGHETHDHHEHVHHDHASKDEKNKVTGAVPGQLPDDITGPVARAAGIEKDHRLEEAVYQQAGWTPVTAAGNNAWSRLMVRLDEIEQSLRFIEKAGNDSGKESSRKINIPSVGMGNGIAHIESPRGIVTLKFHIHEGKLAHMHLTTPSVALAGLVKPVTEQQELADALIAVNSLDISPWEINP